MAKLTNLARFLAKFLLLALFCVLSIAISFGQAERSKRAKSVRQQTSFSSEGKIDKSVKLPQSVLKQLSRVDEGRLDKCQKNIDLPALRKKKISEHFIASEINVRNKKGGLDVLVVKSNSGCFDGAHSSRFWVFFKNKKDSIAKYRLDFEVPADALWVSDETSRTYPEIESMYHTAVELYTTNWRHNGRAYRTTSCYVEEIGSDKKKKIKCGG